MNIFHDLTTMQAIKTIILFIFLFIALVLVVYNWIYHARMITSSHQTDLHPPKNINILVKASIFSALFTVVLIIVLLLFHSY